MTELIDLTQSPEQFFEILPEDWQTGIQPFWIDYINKAKIYGLKDPTGIIAGGIIFSDVSPDTKIYESKARHWFDKGYLYIGFLFVKENRRKEGHGSFWIKQIRTLQPEQKYWLAIDDYELLSFYTSLEFYLEEEVQNGEYSEWILVEKDRQ